ncbi:CBS domain-containing protein [Streptomyces sp. NPDC087425]|uniref:CBS domain-containing protein n=1 Tax=Streptomyces sp. NPDC087425 TaxID=3365787 RepID=UPI0038136C63
MTRAVVAVGRDAGVKEMVRLMRGWKVSALPVLEGEGRVVGVVSEADLLPKAEFRTDAPGPYRARLRPVGNTPRARRRHLADQAKSGANSAAELMTSPALTVRPDALLTQAARTMARNRVERLPVVNGVGLLEGVVTRADLLGVFLRDDEEIAREIRRGLLPGLFPGPGPVVGVEVREGVVTFTGQVRDRSLIPVAARLARAVEGVVDVEFGLAEVELGLETRALGLADGALGLDTRELGLTDGELGPADGGLGLEGAGRL